MPSPSPAPVTVTSTDVVKTALTGSDYAGLAAGTGNTIALAYERGAPSKVDGSIGPEVVNILASSALRLTIEPVSKTYTLEFAQPGYPAKEVYDLGHEPTGFLALPGSAQSDFGKRVVTTYRYSDGTTQSFTNDVTYINEGQQPVDNGKGQFEVSRIIMNLGLRYVDWGVWTHDFHDKTGPNSFALVDNDAKNQVFIVSGRRTAAGEIPATGKATYNAFFSGGIAASGKITLGAADKLVLNADFAIRLIAATIDAPTSVTDFEGDTYRYWGFDLNGSAPIASSGDFQIGLTGTAFLTAATSDNGTAQSKALTGSIQGALFGPAAEEAGGVLQLMLNGSPLFYGSFAGARQGK